MDNDTNNLISTAKTTNEIYVESYSGFDVENMGFTFNL